jgi:hypothetical protein
MSTARGVVIRTGEHLRRMVTTYQTDEDAAS